jgi:RNA polymerase sigma-54 factor
LEINNDFNSVRSQKLLLIPQLKQAIELLEMDSAELFHYVENQLDTNPVLEEAPNIEASDDEAGIEPPGFKDPVQYGRMDDHAAEQPEDDHAVGQPETVLTLKQHLLLQLDALCLDRSSYIIGEFIIDNTDDNGYLKADTAELASCLGVPESRVLEVLDKIQTLEPPGICARDLGECLVIQLKQLRQADKDSVLVATNYLDAIASNDAEFVSRSTGIPIGRVHEIFDIVRSLEPKPGREFYRSESECPVVPDLIICETKNGLEVMYNDEAFPNICLSESYIAGDASDNAACMGEELSEKLNDAIWLIKCLEQREDIIFAIGKKLCDLEQPFFKEGPKALELLDHSTFAASLCMHETILEKALRGKYLQCRWGMFELADFFRKQPVRS